MAIGSAKVMGISLMKNFNRPFFATSMSDIWKRWHISLSSWLRDYLYISLGGNRQGELKTYRNLLITMLLGGLWHGASWTFVLWGLLHGLYLVGQRMLSPPWQRLNRLVRMPAAITHVVAVMAVFALTCVAWVFFRAQSLSDAVVILDRIATEGSWGFASLDGKFLIVRGAAVVGVLLVVDMLIERKAFADLLVRVHAARLGAIALAVWAIAWIGSFSGSQFIYFQF